MREKLIKTDYNTNTKRSLTEMNEMAGQELIVVVHHPERMADLATNINKDVIYSVKGKTIKHHSP